MFTYNLEDVTEKEVTFKNAALESFPTRCEEGVVELNRMCEHIKAHYILFYVVILLMELSNSIYSGLTGLVLVSASPTDM